MALLKLLPCVNSGHCSSKLLVALDYQQETWNTETGNKSWLLLLGFIFTWPVILIINIFHSKFSPHSPGTTASGITSDLSVSVISKGPGGSHPASPDKIVGGSHLLLVRCQVGKLLWKAAWRLRENLNISLSWVPVIMPLTIQPSKLKISVYTRTSTSMFIANLSIISKMQRQLRCPLAYKWINTYIIVHADNGTLFKATKKQAIKTWKDMEEIYLNIT